MSEKRFELAYEQGDWWAVRDGDITLWKEEVVGLLNEQQSKITELEIELTDCKNRKEQSEYNLQKKIRELENKFEKIPPKIKELWVE